MGLFLCDICDEQLSDSHVCDKEVIKKRISTLEERACLAERQSRDMQNAIFMILHTLPTLEGDEVVVKTNDLKRLWEAAKCQWFSAKTADQFLSCWMAMHKILREAYNVFRSRNFKKNLSLLEKLNNLHKACIESKPILGYQDSNLDKSPEQLMEKT